MNLITIIIYFAKYFKYSRLFSKIPFFNLTQMLRKTL